ncbi:CYC2 Cytochrome c mitochondrial import factor CYC2 [Candida maltosa Xu316]|uniref:Cytochrome c assembly flavoprotein, putative n=1 Tax=Candida maltosa (strain Xu316) TaxID=1245528 RepID=M3INL3_CANMX|nr:Cytochrome c assembly flavoprotein, putative [Candida maltosa Xu316]
MLCLRSFRLATSNRGRLLSQIRFNTNKPEDESKKEVSSPKDESVQSFNIKQTTSKSAPAPMEGTGIEQLMTKNNKPYIPKLKHQRESFEYPGLPNQDEYTNHIKKQKTVTRWTRYVPKILTAIVVAWSGYTYYVWMSDSEEGEDSNDLLHPDEFHKFIVAHKEQIDDDHYLIELVPKFNRWEYSHGTDPDGKTVWNGDRFWSVEVKQPDINVVRSYTPLPLYFLQSEYTKRNETKPLLKVINPEIDVYDKNGRMCLYVKRYKDGEVSRYITDRKVGDELELRGPKIEYKFPYHPLKKLHQRPIFKDLPSKIEPDNTIESIKKENNLPDVDNIVFYAAGTGIAPILQLLLSNKPYMGHVDIHYSARSEHELGQGLSRFLLFLDKLDRINITNHYDNQPKTVLSKKDVIAPTEPNFITPKTIDEKAKYKTAEDIERLRAQAELQNSQESVPGKIVQTPQDRGEFYETAIEQATKTMSIPKKKPSLAIVCGPEGFVGYVAGPKDLVRDEQGEVKGLLGDKNWDNSNVFKL